MPRSDAQLLDEGEEGLGVGGLIASRSEEHEPDLVLHGHAHAGTFRGSIGQVPVFNVSVPVMGQDFRLFELDVSDRARTALH
jgi:Icc-related predicted phosphoesterase